MNNLLKSTLALACGLVALILVGCGGDSGGAATGPAGAASFAGTSLSFNPTINFAAGGDLTYLNNEAGSPFPSADPAVNGKYTYVPNASYTAGTLTIYDLDGIQDPVVLEISNFTRTGPNVTGFTARAGGQSYPVSVTGTLAAYQRPSGGGGGSGESRADDIPAGWRGSHELTFDENNTGSGIADGTVTTFTLAARTLSFGGKTLSNPIWYNGNQYEYIFKDGNIWYCVSGSDTALNEINIQSPYTGNFNTTHYGQYNDKDNPASGGAYNSIGIAQNGSYVGGGFTATVTNVVGPDSLPSAPHLSVPILTDGQTVSFTFSNGGDLTSPSLTGTFSYGGSDAVSVTYNRIDGANSDVITIHRATNQLPASLSIYSVRNQVTPEFKSTQVTYTLTVNIP